MTDYTHLQTRCRRGEATLADANNLLAECHAALGRLRAENSGLKTGYQAYERVNAELKAEVDSLTREADRQYTTIEAYRHDAERYQWLRSGASVILNKEVGFTAESGARIYSAMPSQRELDSAIDAAMGKGEQS